MVLITHIIKLDLAYSLTISKPLLNEGAFFIYLSNPSSEMVSNLGRSILSIV